MERKRFFLSIAFMILLSPHLFTILKTPVFADNSLPSSEQSQSCYSIGFFDDFNSYQNGTCAWPNNVGRWIVENGYLQQVETEYMADEHTRVLWHLNEGTGEAIYDDTINQNTGQLNGEWANNSIWTADSRFGSSAINFTGKEAYITVPDGPSLNFDSNLNFTIEAWFKLGNSKENQIIVYKGTVASYYALYVDSLGHVKGTLWDGTDYSTGNPSVTSPEAYNDNTWHHVAFVRNRNTQNVSLFVDGFRVASEPDRTGDLSNSGNLFIGSVDGSQEFANGVIDEIRISDCAQENFFKLVTTGLNEWENLTLRASILLPNKSASGGLVFRYNNASSYYCVLLDEPENSVLLYKIQRNFARKLASTEMVISADTWYNATIRLRGNTTQVRVWKKGENEPAGETINVTDASFLKGKIGVITFQSCIRVDYVKADFAEVKPNNIEGLDITFVSGYAFYKASVTPIEGAAILVNDTFVGVTNKNGFFNISVTAPKTKGNWVFFINGTINCVQPETIKIKVTMTWYYLQIRVLDILDQPLPNVLITTKVVSGKTNQNGSCVLVLPEGEATLQATLNMIEKEVNLTPSNESMTLKLDCVRFGGVAVSTYELVILIAMTPSLVFFIAILIGSARTCKNKSKSNVHKMKHAKP